MYLGMSTTMQMLAEVGRRSGTAVILQVLYVGLQ